MDPSAERSGCDWNLDALIRTALLAVLVLWCLSIMRPFVVPAAWAVILAIGTHPLYESLVRRLGGRKAWAAVVVTILMLLCILVPALVLSGSVAEDAQLVIRAVESGHFRVPPPPEAVARLPVVGASLHGVWLQASDNLEAALARLTPELQSGFEWLVKEAAGAGKGFLEFLVAIVLAGFLLAKSDQGRVRALAVARRLAGERGERFLDLAGVTVRSVTRGILGVAVIQAILAGIGWMVAGIPAAGLWAVLALILSAVQIGILPLALAILVYFYFHADMPALVVLALWSLFVGSIDNVLKPLLLGRGVDVPLAVIFVGAIGGFLTTGIIGLFVGAVVLVVGYKLFDLWLQDAAASQGSEDEGSASPRMAEGNGDR